MKIPDIGEKGACRSVNSERSRANVAVNASNHTCHVPSQHQYIDSSLYIIYSLCH